MCGCKESFFCPQGVSIPDSRSLMDAILHNSRSLDLVVHKSFTGAVVQSLFLLIHEEGKKRFNVILKSSALISFLLVSFSVCFY